jgi:hypothetical protein
LSVAGVIVGELAHTLLSGSVNATVAQLGAMSKPRDMHYVAARDFNLYRATLSESPIYELNPKLGCATVVAAEFEAKNVECTQYYNPRVMPDMANHPDDIAPRAIREDDSVENILRRANICVHGQSHSVYEVRFEISDDRTAFRLESAGLWVNTLLSTKSKTDTRGIVYSMDIAEPTADSNMQVLSSAWVNFGELKAGYASEDPPVKSRSEWIRVPPMSGSAQKAYQIDTSVHQDVYAEVQALQRSVTRDKRQLDSMRQRLATASDSIKDAIQGEMDSLEIRVLRSASVLDARQAEYADLPLPERNYMPVSIRFGVIESRSEKRALGSLAAFLDENSSQIVDVTANKIGLERSASFEDAANPENQQFLEQARIDYFDAVVAFRQSSDGSTADSDELEVSLTRARETYNAARAAAGIAQIP